MKVSPNISLQTEEPFCGVCNSDDAAPLQRTPPRTHVNASTKGAYTGTRWAVRAGAATTCSTHRKGSDHERHPPCPRS